MVTHEGRYVRFRDAVASPMPLQAHLPILVGGHGSKTTLPVVAQFADHWNAYGTPDLLTEKASELAMMCDRQGRDFEAIQRSVTVNVVVRSRVSVAEAVWDRYRELHQPREDGGRALIGGTVEQVVESLVPYMRIGIRGFVLGFRAPWDIETIQQAGALRAALEAQI
jgi:alkanesulfonate monooxygenase SsuD/methylene tetrahydromethanopterin reductase-like flavin-dependent oxidoreductase (luciferase family)